MQDSKIITDEDMYNIDDLKKAKKFGLIPIFKKLNDQSIINLAASCRQCNIDFKSVVYNVKRR